MTADGRRQQAGGMRDDYGLVGGKKDDYGLGAGSRFEGVVVPSCLLPAASSLLPLFHLERGTYSVGAPVEKV